jgi:hypothetical protein
MSNLSAPTLRILNDTGSIAGVTSDPTVLVEGTLAPGAVWEYRFRERDEALGSFIAPWSGWSPVPSNREVRLDGLEDGRKRVEARQLLRIGGQADQVSDPFQLQFDLLRSLPATPSLSLRNDTGTTARVTSDGRIDVEGLEKNNLWEYRLDSTDWLSGVGNQILVEGDGFKGVFVRQIDGAGNKSLSSDEFRFTLDTKPPIVPILRLSNDTGQVVGTTQDGTVTIAGLEPGATWDYRLRLNDEPSFGDWIPGSGPTLNAAAEGDGRKRIQLRQYDQAGNRSESSETLDFTLKRDNFEIPQLSLRNDTGETSGFTRDGRIRVDGISRDASWQYRVNEGEWLTGEGKEINLTPTGDGDKRVVARSIDGAGNLSATGTALEVVLDTKAPAALKLRLAKDTGREEGLTRRGVVRIGRQEDGASWEYQILGEAGWSPDWQEGTGTQIDLGKGADGKTGLRVRQIDRAGNRSDTKDLRFTLKRAIAPLHIDSIGAGADNKITAVRGGSQIFGRAEPGVNVTLRLGKKSLGQTQSNRSGDWKFSLDDFAVARLGQGTFRGRNSLIARQVDGAGNRSGSRSELTINTTVSSMERDRLIGSASNRDTFLIRASSDSLIGGFDTIVNYESRDRIQVRGQRYGSRITSSIRTVNTLGDMARFLNTQRLLGSTEVVAFKVAQPQYQSGTFLAASTGRSGFQSDRDVVLFLADFNIDKGGNSVTLI